VKLLNRLNFSAMQSNIIVIKNIYKPDVKFSNNSLTSTCSCKKCGLKCNPLNLLNVTSELDKCIIFENSTQRFSLEYYARILAKYEKEECTEKLGIEKTLDEPEQSIESDGLMFLINAKRRQKSHENYPWIATSNPQNRIFLENGVMEVRRCVAKESFPSLKELVRTNFRFKPYDENKNELVLVHIFKKNFKSCYCSCHKNLGINSSCLKRKSKISIEMPSKHARQSQFFDEIPLTTDDEETPIAPLNDEKDGISESDSCREGSTSEILESFKGSSESDKESDLSTIEILSQLKNKKF
jgi:hypothetical protein